MLVAHISDTHIMAPKEPNERSLERINFFQRCVEDINSLRTIPDVVIHTGDLTDNGLPQEYIVAKDILLSNCFLILFAKSFIVKWNVFSVSNKTSNTRESRWEHEYDELLR